MNLSSLQCQLNDFEQHRIALVNKLLSFKHWYENSGLHSSSANYIIDNAIDNLRSLHSYTAVAVGEFSRGKTEILNALLFSRYQCRILPVRPERTTLCPTEIGFDPSLPNNSIQLLPMSTRKGGSSVSAYKKIPNHWINIRFDTNNPASLQDALGRIAEKQYVTEDQARELGFNCSLLNRHPENINHVEVPSWRYAHINMDHPLLVMGLRLIDTPGLNAQGSEPELTLATLADADSLLFTLAADAPASLSDRTIWRDYINQEDNSQILVILNKIDSLWDDLISAPSEEACINSVRTETALALGLPLQQVVPVSAKKALLAKARGDSSLLEKSNFEQIEATLTSQLIEKHKLLIKHPAIEDAIILMRQTRDQLHTRLLDQAEMLQSAQNQSENHHSDGLITVKESIKEMHRNVHQASLIYRSYERSLKDQFEKLAQVFDQRQLERIFNYLHDAAADPDPILRPAMKAAFKQIQRGLQTLAIEADNANHLLKEIYESPIDGSSMPLTSRKLDITVQKNDFSRLKHRYEKHLQSIEDSPHERAVVRYFLLSLSHELRRFITDTNNLLIEWHAQALTPISYPNECQKQLLQKELLILSRLGNEQKPSDQQMLAIRAELTLSEDRLFTLNQLLDTIESLEPTKSVTSKVVPFHFARRRSSI